MGYKVERRHRTPDRLRGASSHDESFNESQHELYDKYGKFNSAEFDRREKIKEEFREAREWGKARREQKQADALADDSDNERDPRDWAVDLNYKYGRRNK